MAKPYPLPTPASTRRLSAGGAAGNAWPVSHDTVIHRIVRPAVRRIAGTGTTPNQITTARLLTGLAAAACFGIGTRQGFVLGGAVFLASMLLDRADGELARQTGQMSAAGYRYDLAADAIASMAAFVGIGIGLAPGHGAAAIGLGLLAGIGIGILFLELNVFGLATVRGYRIGAGLTADPDDAMVLVPVLVWLGFAWPMLVAASVITPLASLIVAATGLAGRRVR